MEKESGDIVYGRHPVMELFKSSGTAKINKLWLLKGGAGDLFEELLHEAKKAGVLFQWVDRDRLRQLAGSDKHQGVVARTSDFEYKELDDLFVQGLPSPLVVLDGVEDPQNLGAILRSAAFFGAGGVIIPRWRAAGLTSTVVKTSAGALHHIPLVQVTNTAQTLLTLKEKGYWVYGADMTGEAFASISYATPTVLVMGAEGAGLHRLVKERCDGLISIPGGGSVASLNVSCAAAVLLQWFTKK